MVTWQDIVWNNEHLNTVLHERYNEVLNDEH